MMASASSTGRVRHAAWTWKFLPDSAAFLVARGRRSEAEVLARSMASPCRSSPTGGARRPSPWRRSAPLRSPSRCRHEARRGPAHAPDRGCGVLHGRHPDPGQRLRRHALPGSARATALGWSLGVGRIGAIVGPTYGAWLLTSGKGLEWKFYGFAIPAVIGAVLIALVPAVRLAAARSDPAGLAQPGALTPWPLPRHIVARSAQRAGPRCLHSRGGRRYGLGMRESRLPIQPCRVGTRSSPNAVSTPR